MHFLIAAKDAKGVIKKEAFEHKLHSEASPRVLCKRARIGYGSGDSPREATMFLNRPLAASMALLAAGMTVPASKAEAQRGETAITCTNPASGVNWQIRIDYDRGTVDANPARIDDRKISWHDAKDGGNYTLDRSSGNLTVVVASSTGGYFLYHRCELKNSG
jgi:hypothetical protein